MPKRLSRHLLLLFVFSGLLLLFSEPTAAQESVVVVEDPVLNPHYTTCEDTYWYQFMNNRGHYAYLTLNVSNLANSTNSAQWRPVIPQSGYYRVEAYVAAHGPITWCTGSGHTIQHDTTDARYVIHSARGAATRAISQYPLGNTWVNLGEYYFDAGQTGYVSLADLNGEEEFTTTVSFSAMRFTFTRLTVPTLYLPVVNHTDPPVAPLPPGVIQGHGFDACHLPTLADMQTWWNNSPYVFYALYIGGISLFHECTPPNSTWVNAAHAQGWSFVPTWVGPQAPCSTYIHRMSSDVGSAYQEGRQEAQAASAAAASMGLSNGGGTVIYYDMEVYGGASAECRQTVKSFMDGWTERLHELGNVAGGYGSRNSYIADWANITHIPDEVWIASWYTSAFDSNANTTSGITWLPGVWANHQRLRQYTGGHNETWGGKTFNIDSDVADGMVALPPGKTLFIPTVITSPSIQDSGWLSTDQGWVVLENRLYWTDDRGSNWQDITPAPVQVAYFLPSGEAWALSNTDSENLSLFHSTSWGKTWDSTILSLPLESFSPLQLSFTSPSSGWIVLHKQTSQAFDIGMLLKTADGGVTWTSSDVPTAAPIQFVSSTEGWLVDPHSGALYRTLDGGLTWQQRRSETGVPTLTSLPKDSTLSGSQTSTLGWSATSTNNCQGEKSSPGFTCTVENVLWQSLDGGNTWQNIPLPTLTQAEP